MTKQQIVSQVKKNGTPKVVEVFVGSVYAPEYEMRTEHDTALSLAFHAAVTK